MNETIIELQQQVNNLSEMPIYHQSVSMNSTEMNAPETNTTQTDAMSSFITDMDTAEAPIAEEQPETIDLGEEIEIPATDTTAEEFIEPASEPETVTIEVPKDDNPNRQLSPEEIAALFASLG